MKKLSKAQQEEKDRLLAELRRTHEEVVMAVVELNEKVKEMWADVDGKVDDHNAVVEQANEFMQTVVESMQSYQDERSEKWQESDAASAFADWQGAWEDQLEELELLEPDLVDEPDDEASASLEEKPDSVEG